VQEKRGKRVRYNGLRPVYELTARAHELAVGALPLNLLFDVNDAFANWRQDYLVHVRPEHARVLGAP
jgi:hypothetical protein